MKKFLISILVLATIIAGIWYYKKNTEIPKDAAIATYRNANIGISFTYPKILTSSTISDIVLLHHEVPFVHQDYCDFKGEGDTTINALTDFNVKLYIENTGLVETMKSVSPYIPQENFINGEVIESPGFIDKYSIGNLKGYKIFEGAEGCGHTIYYISISNKKTLVIVDDLITVFTGAIDVENKSKAEALPGVINKEKQIEIFDLILKTLTVQ